MTVLHSRNADAADPADVADAADVKDPQDAAAEPDLREDLGRYAELGAFTLAAETHAWYAAVDTVETPEDARAASTALAELRGSDLTQTWEAVVALAAEVKLDEPDTVAKTALLVEMLQRVHRTSATLFPAAYDADLEALAAATADSTWRREHGVKLSWLRGRSLRKQALALATDRRIRREDLHEALTSAEVERRAWTALAPTGTLPRVPADGALVDRTAQAFEAINTGLRGLARLLPDHDLDGLPFAELIDLVERLAADEGTLYRLPTIRGLRAGLEEAGLVDLLAELAAAKADRRAAEAAYTARQALVAGQRDGLAKETVTEETVVEAPGTEESTVAVAVAVAVVEVEVEVEVEAESGGETESEVVADAEAESGVEEAAAEEPVVEEPADRADAEAAALQALAGGQRDGLVEEVPVPVTVPVAETDEAVTAAESEVETETEPESDTAADAEAASDTAAADIEPEAEPAEAQTPAAVVSLPAPSPAADDLVAVATAALTESVPADEAVAETVEVEEAAAEAEVEEPVVEADESSAEVAEVPEVSEVAEAESAVETEPEAVVVEPAVEAAAVEAEVAEVAAESETEAVVSEETVAEVVEPAVESEETVVETGSVVVPEPEAIVEVPAVEPVAEVESELVAEEPVAEEPVSEPEPVVEAPAAEPESAVEPEPEPEPVAEEPVSEPEPVVETPAAEPEPEPVAEARPAKPDFTPGRAVTAYSADELLAVVRWVDGDGVERTDEELLRAAMKELGFARLGPRIKEALGAAVAAARG
ncbi:hypothetical protein ACFRAR_01515 [Kitasatospora sp. NPDC056651]|uniref:hypothetical protein n=1 Tax=Kitasatospora sp. NPDC056651 TaxID=3345892 RepID=UPI0036B33A5F